VGSVYITIEMEFGRVVLSLMKLAMWGMDAIF